MWLILYFYQTALDQRIRSRYSNDGLGGPENLCSALNAQPAETWRKATPLTVDSLALDTVSIMSLCLVSSTYQTTFPFAEHFYAGDHPKDTSHSLSLHCHRNPMFLGEHSLCGYYSNLSPLHRQMGKISLMNGK